MPIFDEIDKLDIKDFDSSPSQISSIADEIDKLDVSDLESTPPSLATNIQQEIDKLNIEDFVSPKQKKVSFLSETEIPQLNISSNAIAEETQKKETPTFFQEEVLKHIDNPGLSDFALAWADGLLANITFGPQSPEAITAMDRLQTIDQKTVGPVVDKVSPIASFIAAFLYTGQGVRMLYNGYKLAQSQYGDLSPTVKGIKRGLSKILGGPEKPIQEALDGLITPQQAGAKLRKFSSLNPERTEQALKDLTDLQNIVRAESKSLRPLGIEPTALGPVFTMEPPSVNDASLVTSYPPPIKAPAISNFVNKMAEPLLSEAAHIPLETIVPGATELENIDLSLERTKGAIARTFTRFSELDAPTRQAFINISEGDMEIRENAAKAALDIYKGINPNELEELYTHLQEPEAVSLPMHLNEAANKAKDVMKWSFKELNKRGLESPKDIADLEYAVDNDLPIPENLNKKLLVPKWPDNEIEALKERERVLQLRLSSTDDPDVALNYQAELQNILARRNTLENVVYFHQISTKPGVHIKGTRVNRVLSSHPSGLLGRKFANRAEAQAAGYTTADLITATADTIYETNRSLLTDEFIKHINRNEDFSRQAHLAPRDWVSIDERRFPAGKYKKYHPAIADAINEITWSGKSKNSLVKAYDKINSTAKIIGFYNPLFMTRYNMSQGIQGVGLRHLKNYPKAIKIWLDKGETYNLLRKNGVFNNVFDMRPTMEDVVNGMREPLEKMPLDFQTVASKILNPLKLIKDSWKFLNEGTWKIDEMQRIATWLAAKDNSRLQRHYSDFEIMELVNDFHANYGKVPKETRQALNRIWFTPTYKISMARILGRMHREPKALWPSLLRHYAMKLAYVFGVPLALNEYLKYKGINKRARVEGYRVIVRDPHKKKERVYSLSDPILELTKLRERPYFRTIEYNLAAVPGMILNAISGPVFHNTNSPEWQQTINAFFKTGAPVVKELMLWRDKDQGTYEKIMQGLGFAYIYYRNKRELPEEPFRTKFLKALDLVVEMRKIFPAGRKERYFVPEKKKKGE